MTLSSPTTLLQTGETGIAASSFTTSAFTPANNSVAVAVVNFTAAGANTPASWTASGGGLSWTNVLAGGGGGTVYSYVAVFVAQVTTGASTQLTVNGLTIAGGNNYYNADVYYLTGHNTAGPTGATAIGTNTSAGAVSVTLSGAPSASSVIMAGLNLAPVGSGGTTTAGASWTALYNNVGAATVLDCQQQYITGTTSATVPWQAQIVGDTPVTAVQWAVEIVAGNAGDAAGSATGAGDASGGGDATKYTVASLAGTSDAAAVGETSKAESIGASGMVALDFGPAPGTNIASALVTGQTGILSTSPAEAWIQGTDYTSDHNAYEHYMMPQSVAVSVTAVSSGVGFTVTGVTQLRLTGQVVCRWAWN